MSVREAAALLGRRAAASLVDLALFALLLALVLGPVLLVGSDPAALWDEFVVQGGFLGVVLYSILFGPHIFSPVIAVYRTLCEASRWEATLGKRLFGLRVQRRDGGRVRWWQALLRALPWWAPAPLLIVAGPLGYVLSFASMLSIPITGGRRSLHDLLAGTVVVRARVP